MALHPPKGCFGKSWDGGNILCRGGLDPTYVHPKTGSNQREACGWFRECAARTNAVRIGIGNQPQQVIPQNRLVNKPQQQQFMQSTSPWAPFHQTAATLMNRLPIQQQQQVYHPQQMMMQPQQMMQPQMAHPMMAMMPYVVPVNYQMPGAQMPGYLTIPEPIVEGQHWLPRLFYNIVRSMAKASGHTAANFFDYSPINPWPTPPITTSND